MKPREMEEEQVTRLRLVEHRPEEGQRIRFTFRFPYTGDKTFTGTYRNGAVFGKRKGDAEGEYTFKLCNWPSLGSWRFSIIDWEPLDEFLSDQGVKE